MWSASLPLFGFVGLMAGCQLVIGEELLAATVLFGVLLLLVLLANNPRATLEWRRWYTRCSPWLRDPRLPTDPPISPCGRAGDHDRTALGPFHHMPVIASLIPSRLAMYTALFAGLLLASLRR